MIIFTIKLLKSIRTAIAGRKYPHQLAWAVAFGVLLGIVPHGNLLALAILILVLTLRVNHAMAGVTAIGVTFLATRLDPFSDQVGHYVLAHEKVGPMMANAWPSPLMPWTDLNNTVVMGSFLIGTAALLPIFMITYPLFRVFAPATESPDDSPATEAAAVSPQKLFIDQPHSSTSPTHLVDHPAPAPTPSAKRIATTTAVVNEASTREHSVDQYLATFTEQTTEQTTEQRVQKQPSAPEHQTAAKQQIALQQQSVPEQSGPQSQTKIESEKRVSVETRIDVIRMTDYREADPAIVSIESGSDHKAEIDRDADTEKPLDEALNYLLRQLRDSQQRKAG